MPDTELFDGCGQQVKANEATRLRSPKSYTEMTRMFADGGESPYRRSTKSPPRSGRSGQRSASDLRRELRRRHVTTGQLFSMMDQDRSDTITFNEFSRGVRGSLACPICISSLVPLSPVRLGFTITVWCGCMADRHVGCPANPE